MQYIDNQYTMGDKSRYYSNEDRSNNIGKQLSNGT